jgi:flagellar secretion chaperone FliS
MAPVTNSQAYLTTMVDTSDRLGLVITVYESALANIKSVLSDEDIDKEKRSEAINKTSKILYALSEALDYSQPGGMAGNLSSLYTFMQRQLFEANASGDNEALRDVKGILSILLNGWTQIANKPEVMALREQETAHAASKKQPPARDGRAPSFTFTA